MTDRVEFSFAMPMPQGWLMSPDYQDTYWLERGIYECLACNDANSDGDFDMTLVHWYPDFNGELMIELWCEQSVTYEELVAVPDRAAAEQAFTAVIMSLVDEFPGLNQYVTGDDIVIKHFIWS